MQSQSIPRTCERLRYGKDNGAKHTTRRQALTYPALCLRQYCMDAFARSAHHAGVRVLAHVKKLDDCFGQFLVRVSCKCGAVREITPEALARLVGRKMTLEKL